MVVMNKRLPVDFLLRDPAVVQADVVMTRGRGDVNATIGNHFGVATIIGLTKRVELHARKACRNEPCRSWQQAQPEEII
jgi:hypothetical protein